MAAAPVSYIFHDTIEDDEHGEDPTEGGTWLLDLVAAVDYLGRGYRHGLTVWDALEEAIRWADGADEGDDDGALDIADPLRAAIEHLLDSETPSASGVAAALQRAVRRWVSCMANRYNDGHAWPHPIPRRAFPPPLLETSDQLATPH